MENDPPIVGIGASAGGIKALQTFFGALPDQPDAIVHREFAPEGLRCAIELELPEDHGNGAEE